MFKKKLSNGWFLAGFFAFFLSLPASIHADQFNDVAPENDHYVAIEYLAKEGVLQGYENGDFSPLQQINRAELTKILVAGKGLEPDPLIYKNCFTDVLEEWFARYVCYAKEQGWVQGYSNGSFLPGSPVNQVEAIKIILEPLFSNGELDQMNPAQIADSLENYRNVDSAQWYAKYLAFGKEKNLLYEFYSSFKPDNLALRGVVAEYLFRSKAVSENGWPAYHDYRRDIVFLNEGMQELVSKNYPCYLWKGYDQFPFYKTYLFEEYNIADPFDHQLGDLVSLYSSGGFCDLGEEGVIFSNVIKRFDPTTSIHSFEHHVITFDSEGSLKKDIKVNCLSAGDYIEPFLEVGENNEMFFSCTGSDVGFYFKKTYLLDLATMEYEPFKLEDTGAEMYFKAGLKPVDSFDEAVFGMIESIESDRTHKYGQVPDEDKIELYAQVDFEPEVELVEKDPLSGASFYSEYWDYTLSHCLDFQAFLTETFESYENKKYDDVFESINQDADFRSALKLKFMLAFENTQVAPESSEALFEEMIFEAQAGKFDFSFVALICAQEEQFFMSYLKDGVFDPENLEEWSVFRWDSLSAGFDSFDLPLSLLITFNSPEKLLIRRDYSGNMRALGEFVFDSEGGYQLEKVCLEYVEVKEGQIDSIVLGCKMIE